jgi:hypothetical protein
MRAQGFGLFSTSAVIDGGKAVAFEYPSGTRYIVPLEYIMSWFAESQPSEDMPVVIRSRRFSDGHLIRIYLSNGRYFDVAWDTVLMACEPAYEHYGGLTAASRALTKKWSKRLKLKSVE